MRDHAVHELHARNVRMLAHVLGGPRIALLRVVAPRPGAAGPAWGYLNLLAPLEQLLADAQKRCAQRSLAASLEPCQGSSSSAGEVDAHLVVRSIRGQRHR